MNLTTANMLRALHMKCARLDEIYTFNEIPLHFYDILNYKMCSLALHELDELNKNNMPASTAIKTIKFMRMILKYLLPQIKCHCAVAAYLGLMYSKCNSFWANG